MNTLKILLASFSLLLFSLIPFTTANAAGLSVFTDHQVIHMVRHAVNMNQNVPFPTGDLPYIGRIGLEYEQNKNLSYQLSYIHRSNVDITSGGEYNYDGVSVGIKLKHCFAYCK